LCSFGSSAWTISQADLAISPADKCLALPDSNFFPSDSVPIRSPPWFHSRQKAWLDFVALETLYSIRRKVRLLSVIVDNSQNSSLLPGSRRSLVSRKPVRKWNIR